MRRTSVGRVGLVLALVAVVVSSIVGSSPLVVALYLTAIALTSYASSEYVVALLGGLLYLPSNALGIPAFGILVVAGLLFMPARGQYCIKRIYQHRWVVVLWTVFSLWVVVGFLRGDPNHQSETFVVSCLVALLLSIVVFEVDNSIESMTRICLFIIFCAALAGPLKYAHQLLGTDTALFREAVASNLSEFAIEHRLQLLLGGGIADRLLFPGQEPNYAAAFLLLPFAIAVSLAASSQRIGVKIACLIFSTSILAQIGGSFSRGGMVGVAFVLLGLGAMMRTRGVAVWLALGAAATVLLASNPLLLERIALIGHSFTYGGVSDRDPLWQASAELFLDFPIFGAGLGATVDALGASAHSLHLEILSDLGIIGVSLWFCLLISPVFLRQSPLSDIGRASLVGLFAQVIAFSAITLYDIKLFAYSLFLTSVIVGARFAPSGGTAARDKEAKRIGQRPIAVA